MIVSLRSKCRFKYTPDEIVKFIQSNGGPLSSVANQVIEDLSRCNYVENTVFKYVLNNGGSRVKAEEVIEEGLLKIYDLILAKKYQGGKLEDFAINTCKNLWRNMRRKKDEQLHLSGDREEMDRPDQNNPEKYFMAQERRKLLQEIFANCLDQSCLKMLQLKHLDGLSHDKIAGQMGLASSGSSREKLYRCIGKAKKCIEKHPRYEELFD